MEISQLLPFLVEIDKLKRVERRTVLHNGGRLENSAEHSWHLAMAVLTFAEYAPKPFDTCKAVRMALLHDLVEIDAGDTFLYADQSGKREEETKALGRLTALLPENTAAEFSKLWNEFEDRSSAEARFVAALDRFLPLYSNYLNHG